MIAWLVAEVDNRLRLDGLVVRAAFRVQKAKQLAQPKEALEKLLNKFPEVEILSHNLGFTPDCYRPRNAFSDTTSKP